MILILHDHAQSKFFARAMGCRRPLLSNVIKRESVRTCIKGKNIAWFMLACYKKHDWKTQSRNLPVEHACKGSVFAWNTLLLHSIHAEPERRGRVIKKEIKLKYVWMILKLPCLLIGQCPIQDPNPLINPKQTWKFGQFDGFWSRAWVAYTNPPGGGKGIPPFARI